MTSEEIIALSKKHTIFEWTAQKNVAPIAVARAEGVYFWTPEGKRFIDFNSQLMSVNIGHGDRRVIEAIRKQAELVTYVAPSFSTEPRAPGREARRHHARRHRRLLLHEWWSRGQRNRLQDRAGVHRAAEDHLVLSFVSWRHRRCDGGNGRAARMVATAPS